MLTSAIIGTLTIASIGLRETVYLPPSISSEKACIDQGKVCTYVDHPVLIGHTPGVFERLSEVKEGDYVFFRGRYRVDEVRLVNYRDVGILYGDYDLGIQTCTDSSRVRLFLILSKVTSASQEPQKP